MGSHTALEAPVLADSLRRLLTDREVRAAMARRGPGLVDGRGALRVLAQMWPEALQLRPARPDDCRLVWQWANEPATRSASFSSAPIPWEEHQTWFRGKLTDPACLLYVALDAAGKPVGQIRFEETENAAVISVSLGDQFHGLGYGPQIIRCGAREVFTRRAVERIDAFVRTDNQVSYRAFIKAGFSPEELTAVRGQPARRLVLRRDGKWDRS
jgi:UDP-2,4-diacetamido-2,4,6-trideoxy-beta-L-altropyranose hydrolase